MKKKLLVVFIGPPCVGKSTTRAKIVEQRDYHVFSTDDRIEEVANAKGLTYNDVFADTIVEVAEQEYIGFKAAIRARKNIIIDQTNLNPANRDKKLREVSEEARKDYTIVALNFKADYNVLQARNLARCSATGKLIPEKILKNMYKSWIPADKDEDFDFVFEVDGDGNFPSLEKL